MKVECAVYESTNRATGEIQKIILPLDDRDLLDSYSDRYVLFENVAFMYAEEKTNHCRIVLPEGVPHEDILVLFTKEHLSSVDDEEWKFDKLIPLSKLTDNSLCLGMN